MRGNRVLHFIFEALSIGAKHKRHGAEGTVLRNNERETAMSILTVLGYGVGALMTISASTLLLPRHVTVTRSATVAAAPEAILKLAASNAGYQEFSPYKSDPSLQIELVGPTSGVGSAFKFTSADVSGTQTVSAVSPSRVDYAIDLGPMGKPKQSIEAIADGASTNVTWRMEADMGFNPIGRVMGLFMDGMQGPVFERGLSNLQNVAR